MSYIIVSGESVRTVKEAKMAYSRHCPGIHWSVWEVLRKIFIRIAGKPEVVTRVNWMAKLIYEYSFKVTLKKSELTTLGITQARRANVYGKIMRLVFWEPKYAPFFQGTYVLFDFCYSTSLFFLFKHNLVQVTANIPIYTESPICSSVTDLKSSVNTSPKCAMAKYAVRTLITYITINL
jgi:hypothetical protein